MFPLVQNSSKLTGRWKQPQGKGSRERDTEQDKHPV